MQEKAYPDVLGPALNAIPSLVFVVDKDMRTLKYNTAVADLLVGDGTTVVKRRAGEVLHCRHSIEESAGCGRALLCKNCIIRSSVVQAGHGNRIVRQRAKIELVRSGNEREINALITASPFHYQRLALVLLVIEDISVIAGMQSLIPICAACKNVRDDKEHWHRFEAYFKKQWAVDFTHGLCPECYGIEIKRFEDFMKAKQR